MKVEAVGTKDFQPPGAQPAEPAFTNEQMRDELAREINMRRTVYPGQVRAGRLTQDKADRQIAIMQVIWNDYSARAAKDKERRQPSLQLDENPPAASLPPATPPLSQPSVIMGAPEAKPKSSSGSETEQPIDKPATPENPKPAEPKKTTETQAAAKK